MSTSISSTDRRRLPSLFSSICLPAAVPLCCKLPKQNISESACVVLKVPQHHSVQALQVVGPIPVDQSSPLYFVLWVGFQTALLFTNIPSWWIPVVVVVWVWKLKYKMEGHLHFQSQPKTETLHKWWDGAVAFSYQVSMYLYWSLTRLFLLICTSILSLSKTRVHGSRRRRCE